MTTDRHAAPGIALLVCCTALAFCFWGCGGDEGGDPASPNDPGEVERADEPPEIDQAEPTALPATPVPTSYGLHLFVDGELRPLAAGDPEWIHPTNADRGFGFERPHGAAIATSRPLFVLRSGSMQLSTIRLSRYEPRALLPDLWWTTSETGRTAWLPEILVPVQTERDPEVAGLVRVRPSDSLAPGFYVLHDGSLIRGRRRADVTTWFPFQVVEPEHIAAPSPDAVWFERSTRCLDELTQLVVDNHTHEQRQGKDVARFDRAAFVRAQGPRIRRCANSLHAVMMAVQDADLKQRARAALLALDTIHNGFDSAHAEEVLAATAPGLEAAPLLEYWLELEALDAARGIKHALASGDVDSAGDQAVVLAGVYLQDGQTRADALGHLLWIVYMLDPEWDQLSEVTARLATGVDPYERVATLLAAHHATRLAKIASRHPDSPLVSLIDPVLANYPDEVMKARDGLDPGRGGSRVAIGPAHATASEPVDPAVVTAIERWFAGRRPALTTCYDDLEQRTGSDLHGLLLARLELGSSMFGSDVQLRVEGVPLPDGSTQTLGDDPFLECVESDALAGLPVDLVTVSAQLTVPLIFGAPDSTLLR